MLTVKSFDRLLDLSTRPKRRLAVALVVKMLGRIHAEEYDYLQRIPPNLQSGPAYAKADYSADCIVDAIIRLSDAY